MMTLNDFQTKGSPNDWTVLKKKPWYLTKVSQQTQSILSYL